jgi:hypothetical protein
MRTLSVIVFLSLFAVVTSARAQQIDAALALGTVSSSASTISSSGFAQGLRGGTFLGFNGDAIFYKKYLGMGGEVFWRTSQTPYGGQIPYRPLFYDFNAIYARRFTKFVGVEALAGIGALSARFYQNSYTNCDIYGNCTNYTSSTHFMGDVGGGVRLYPYHNFFVRPEARLYLVHNNVEFSSGRIVRYGVSIGYTFGGNSGTP